MGRRTAPQKPKTDRTLSETATEVVRLVLASALHVDRAARRPKGSSATANAERVDAIEEAMLASHEALLRAWGEDAVVVHAGKATVRRKDIHTASLLRALSAHLRALPDGLAFEAFTASIATCVRREGVVGVAPTDLDRMCQRASEVSFNRTPTGGPAAYMAAARGAREYAKRLLASLGRRPRHADYAEAAVRGMSRARRWSRQDEKAFEAAWGRPIEWTGDDKPASHPGDLDTGSLGLTPGARQLAEHALVRLGFPRRAVASAVATLFARPSRPRRPATSRAGALRGGATAPKAAPRTPAARPKRR